MPVRFHDRRDAGRQLAARLADLAAEKAVTVVALPRGGVPVGAELAEALGAPLEICLVRKLGAPGNPEYAMGAIAAGGVTVLHDETVRALGVDAATLARITAAEAAELARREARYRRGRPPQSLAGRVVVVVDDGLATGTTARAAVLALRHAQPAPARIVLAVPVAPAEVVRALAAEVDELVCLWQPAPFHAVGAHYRDFRQVDDEAVTKALAEAGCRRPRPVAKTVDPT